MLVSEEPACVPRQDNLDNLKLGDLKDGTRTYILKVHDTIQPLMLDGKHGLSFEGVLIALSYFGADDSDSELLMAQEVYHRWTKAGMLVDDVELSWLVEHANLRRCRWSLEEFETIATRWLREKDENSLFRRSEEVLASNERLAKFEAASVGRQKMAAEKKEAALKEQLEWDMLPLQIWNTASQIYPIDVST
ncbi:hypothetical protein ARSEF4850_007378 [Beauveria asiatica]